MVSMVARVSRLPLSLDPLIAEAKRRARKRHVLVAMVLLLAAATATAVVATRSPAEAFSSIPWTRGEYTQMRYCQGPNPMAGNFLAASSGVSCATAHAIINALSPVCHGKSPCVTHAFRCRAYWSGRFWPTFQDTNHALCSDGARRIAWDGG